MQQRFKDKLPYGAAAASAIIFGFSFLFTKSALDNLDMFQLLASRFLLAGIFLHILRLAGLIKVQITRDKLKGLLLVSLFQPILYFVFETIGVNLTTASESGVIISVIPVVVALLAAPLLQEHFLPRQWLSVIGSVCGVILITLPKFKEGASGQLGGTFALLAAVLAGGLYNIYSKRASKESTPVEITYVMMWVGAILFGAITFGKPIFMGDVLGSLAVFRNFQVLLALAYLGLLSSVVAFFCMNYSLAKLETSRSAVFINLTPVVSVFAGVVFRGEAFSPIQMLGSLIILAGVLGVNRGYCQEQPVMV